MGGVGGGGAVGQLGTALPDVGDDCHIAILTSALFTLLKIPPKERWKNWINHFAILSEKTDSGHYDLWMKLGLFSAMIVTTLAVSWVNETVSMPRPQPRQIKSGDSEMWCRL